MRCRRRATSGVVVPPSDFLGLATAFKRLMLDDDLRHELGRFGRHMAETTYDSRLIAKRIAAEYRRLLED